jgi:C1A family cysteine protease
MIEVELDHSLKMGEARSQGKRLTCLAFVASDLNAAANATPHLSVDYLCHHAAKSDVDWKPGMAFTLDSMLNAVQSQGQPAESLYPYDLTDHAAPLKAPAAELEPLYRRLNHGQDSGYDEVVHLVRTGGPVGVVMAVTQSLVAPKAGIVAFDPFALPDQYHAVVAVGIGQHKDSGEEHLLIRNSWGASWGQNGHAWIPATHMTLHLLTGFLV